jgi:hypothetical protein
MSTIEIKQQLLQFIEKSDEESLMKLYDFVNKIVGNNDKIVTYTTSGKGLNKEQYKIHINTISEEIKNGAKTFSTNEVKDFILKS